MALFSKQQYIALERALHAARETHSRSLHGPTFSVCIAYLTKMLKEDNPSFDSERFLREIYKEPETLEHEQG